MHSDLQHLRIQEDLFCPAAVAQFTKGGHGLIRGGVVLRPKAGQDDVRARVQQQNLSLVAVAGYLQECNKPLTKTCYRGNHPQFGFYIVYYHNLQLSLTELYFQNFFLSDSLHVDMQ